jgi:hypothetical protein
MKTLSLWAERKWEPYNFGPDYPSVMFWLITLGALISYAQTVWTVMEYYNFLPTSVLFKAGLIMLVFPFTWTVYYRLHRHFKRFSEESTPSNQRLIKKVQALSIAFALVTYILFSFCLSILRGLLEKLYH